MKVALYFNERSTKDLTYEYKEYDLIFEMCNVWARFSSAIYQLNKALACFIRPASSRPIKSNWP